MPRFTGFTSRPISIPSPIRWLVWRIRSTAGAFAATASDALEALGRLGADTWFQLGDLDLATHLYRTERLRQGATLAEVTSEITPRSRFVPRWFRCRIERVRTRICTPSGELEFQTYFVKRRARDRVTAMRFEGAPKLRPRPACWTRSQRQKRSSFVRRIRLSASARFSRSPASARRCSAGATRWPRFRPSWVAARSKVPPQK